MDRLSIKRRLDELKHLIRNLLSYQYPCDFNSLDHYLMGIKMDLFEEIILDWFEVIDNEVIWEVVMEFFYDEISSNYIDNCDKQ